MKTYKFIGGIHACMILASNAPNDPGPEYVLADEAMDSYNSGRDKGWSAGYHKGQVELAQSVTEKDARIAELTAERDRYKDALQWIIKRPASAAEDIANNALSGESYPPRNALKDG